MLFALYIPSWEGATRALPAQCVVLGVLALALCAYARQRYGTSWSIVALAAGLLVGVEVGLLWAWWDWGVGKSPPDPSRTQLFESSTLAYFELGHSAVAGALGLLAGWL